MTSSMLSENNKREKLVGKLLVGLFTLSAMGGAMFLSYNEESGNADSQRSIDKFEKTLSTYIEQGGRSDVDPLGGLKTSNSLRIEIEESVFLEHRSTKSQTRFLDEPLRRFIVKNPEGRKVKIERASTPTEPELENVFADSDARAAALGKEREALEKAANALRSYKNQSIAKGKIFKSVALYNQQTVQKQSARDERFRTIVKDSAFLALPPQEKRRVLLEIDSDFRGLSQKDQDQVIGALSEANPNKTPHAKSDSQGFDPDKFIADAIIAEEKALQKNNDKDDLGFIPDDLIKETEESRKATDQMEKNAIKPWNVQSNLALYGKVAAWTLGGGLMAYIAARLFVFVTVLLWWFMIDRIKDITRAIKG